MCGHYKEPPWTGATMPRRWINLAELAAAGKPDYRDHYQKTVDNKHNKGRIRDRIGRFRDRPGEDERADDRDQEDRPDREDDE